jgi:probable phosphoglycerate mutase
MGRCIETGAAIAEAIGSSSQPVDGLNDIDYGQWQGMTRGEAAQRWQDEVDMWFRKPHLAVIPGGETLAAVSARASLALHEILRRHRGETVVLVGHDSVNRVLLLHALELPLSRYWYLRQAPCAVNELDFDGAAFTILSLNETFHLADL